MSEPDEDIRNLFKKIGQSVSYQEIRHQSQTEEARGRWPLLHSLQSRGEYREAAPAPELKPLFPGSPAHGMAKLPGFLGDIRARVEEEKPAKAAFMGGRAADGRFARREEVQADKAPFGSLFGKPAQAPAEAPAATGLFRGQNDARGISGFFGKAQESQATGGLFSKQQASDDAPSGAGLFRAPNQSRGISGLFAKPKEEAVRAEPEKNGISGFFGKLSGKDAQSRSLFGGAAREEASQNQGGGMFNRFMRQAAPEPARSEVESIFSKLAKS